MRVCFLGTASAEPTAEDGDSSFLLEAGSHLVLVDASGSPVQSLLRAGRDPLSVDILVLTHHHADHLGGYPSLVQSSSCLGRKRPLTVLCAEFCRSRVRGLPRIWSCGSCREATPCAPHEATFPQAQAADPAHPGIALRCPQGRPRRRRE
jgi:ribonuclease BN (tRNA processing enzyme)